ncbi:efflux RND transporter permease subunit, partial [Acinetobacter baumannii]
FVDRGRVKRVYVQGDAPYRSAPEDLGQWYVRGNTGQMVPFSAFATEGWSAAAPSLSRFTGIPSFEFSGQAAPGRSSGEAMDRIAQLASHYPG